MKRLTALLLCCLMVGSFALQSAAAPLGDLLSAQAQVEQKQPEQSDGDTTPSTPEADINETLDKKYNYLRIRVNGINTNVADVKVSNFVAEG